MKNEPYYGLTPFSFSFFDFLYSTRWGDYSCVSLDPVDSETFWSIQVFTPKLESWSTQINSVKTNP